MQPILLKEKVVWLTGASQGIGKGLCRELVRRGARVAVTARSADALLTLERELSPGVRAFPGDVTDLDAMRIIAAKIEESMGPVEVVIANAGSCFYINEDEFSSKACLQLMELNYGGVLHCIDAVLPGMLKRGRGAIVGVASLAGYRGLPRAGAYGATKAALINFLEALRFQLQRRGVSVTIVNPGFVETPLTAKNNFPMLSVITTERSARYICDGLESGKKEIAYPPGFALFMKLSRVIPFPLYEAAAGYLWKRLGYV